MNNTIQLKSIVGLVPIIAPGPYDYLSEWVVQIDDQRIRIESSNRVLAYLKAKLLYPSAKHIRVIKQIKKRNYPYI
jgi:hypothetical protein